MWAGQPWDGLTQWSWEELCQTSALQNDTEVFVMLTQKKVDPEWPQKQAEQTKMMHVYNQTVPTVSLAIRTPVPFQSCPSHCWPTHIAHWQSANISTVGMLLTVCAGSRGEQRETIIENYDQGIKDNKSGKLPVCCTVSSSVQAWQYGWVHAYTSYHT